MLPANTDSRAPKTNRTLKDPPVSFSISIHNVSVVFVHDLQNNVPNMPMEYLDFSSVEPRVASCSIKRLQLGITLSEKSSVDSFEMEALKLYSGILSSRGPLLTPIFDIPMVCYCLEANNVLVIKCRQIEVGFHPYQLTLLRALAIRWNFQKEKLTQSCVRSKQGALPHTADASLALQQMDFTPVEIQIAGASVSLLALPSLNSGILVVGESLMTHVQPKSLRFSWNRLEVCLRESLVTQVDPCGSNDESKSMSNSYSQSQTDSSNSSLGNQSEFYDVSRDPSSASFVSKYYSIGDEETLSFTSHSLGMLVFIYVSCALHRMCMLKFIFVCVVGEDDCTSTLNNEALTSVLTIAFDTDINVQQGVEASLLGKSAKVFISPIRIVFCVDPIPSMIGFMDAYGNYLSAHVDVEDGQKSTVVVLENAPLVRDLEVEFGSIAIVAETKYSGSSLDEQFSPSIESAEDFGSSASQIKDFVSARLSKCFCSYSSGNAGQKFSLRVLGLLFQGESCSEAKKNRSQSAAVVGVQNLNIQCSILHKRKDAQTFKADVSCDQITTWINEKNILPAQHVILRLRDCMAQAHAASFSDSGNHIPQSWPSSMINSTVMMSLGRLSVVLASSIADKQVYLMEGNVGDVSVMGYFLNGVAHGSASCNIGIAVPIVQHGVWANVLDKTSIKLQAVSPHLDQISNPIPGSKMAHLDLEVGSANLTMTSEILHSISLCEAFISSLTTKKNHMDLEEHMGMDWVVNHTEFDILLSFSEDDELFDTRAIVLEPGAKYYPSQISTRPYESGLPDTEMGISQRGEYNSVLGHPSPDFINVKLSGSDSRPSKIDMRR